MKLSWHDYQLSMSLEIKCLWNYGMKLSIESGCFIQISFHFIWHGNLENNAMKLSTETGLRHLSSLFLLFVTTTASIFLYRRFYPTPLSIAPISNHTQKNMHSEFSIESVHFLYQPAMFSLTINQPTVISAMT
jgi:hypothetical protein